MLIINDLQLDIRTHACIQSNLTYFKLSVNTHIMKLKDMSICQTERIITNLLELALKPNENIHNLQEQKNLFYWMIEQVEKNSSNDLE